MQSDRKTLILPLKCVIWDLDNTLWSGTLAEGDEVELRHGAAEIVRELDRRGILQSVSSKNSPEEALSRLDSLGLSEFFLYPQIGWGTKTASVERIAHELDLSLNSVAFVDDEKIERDEILFSHPEVLCLDPGDLRPLLLHPRLSPKYISEEAGARRRMYVAECRRKVAEQRYSGSCEEFLSSLEMVMRIQQASRADLCRAAELTSRTHRLNTTGQVYSVDELLELCSDRTHLVYTARLDDKYGTYGIIGLAVVKIREDHLLITLLLMSCRVASRGLGMVFVAYLMKVARDRQLGLQVEFVPSDANRIMDVTFRLAGFQEMARHGQMVLLSHELSEVARFPHYINVIV